MPKAKEKAPTQKSEQQKKAKKPRMGWAKYKYIVGIIIIVAIIGVAIYANYYIIGNQSNKFYIFQSNFNSAPRVAIFVTAYNGTVLSGTIGCATAIIEQVVASKTNHRDPSTIDLNIINQTSCISSTGLNGKTNYTTTSVQNCLNISRTEPTIYINYSQANTTIISPDYLYISGTSTYLQMCGVASEIS